ncbi:MAG TPA: hypothetical protein VMT15_20420 [Bryobacteraceae bacterium]|nr:hypothetical protein [Bryobacteraceae bacterium]
MSAASSGYSTQFLLRIERTVTLARLSRYLTASSQDITQAVQLYEYNVQLSEALYGALHGLEVTVRNAAHHALSASYGVPTWYDRVSLTKYWTGVLKDAKNKVGAAPGKVVAELTFGFWVDLCSKRNNNILWVHRKLSRAFPNTAMSRDQVHQRLKIIQALRNRISHHEPVLTSSKTLYAGRASMLTVPELLEPVEWVCADTAQWIKTKFRCSEAERVLEDVHKLGITL